MLQRNKKIGNFGETIAIQYLKKHKYRIISQNFQNSNQEIDIIAKKNDKWVFVEVKTSVSDTSFKAEFYINKRKIMNLKRIINRISYYQNIPSEMIRVDLIAVNINKFKQTAKIKHYLSII